MLELARDQRVVLNPCSWETYERILLDHRDRSSPRFTYDQGVLEIMSPSPEHEITSEAIKQLIWELCAERGIPVLSLGSTTQRRESLQKGVEPDSSYFFVNLSRDPARDAPDLMVEVELTRSSLDKMMIFYELGVPEVWRWVDNEIHMYRLESSGYLERPESSVLPVTAQQVTHVLRRFEPTTWPATLRGWVRSEDLTKKQQPPTI